MISVIAGSGSLPVEASLYLLQQNKPFFVVCLFPEDNYAAIEETTKGSIEMVTQSAYSPSAILALLKKKKTKEVLLIGKVDKRALLKKVRLDWLGLKLLASVLYKSDTKIMERILAEFSTHNIGVLSQDIVLKNLLIEPGTISGTLTDSLKQDIYFGIKLAKEISALEIGQTVIVKNGMPLAIEAIEGTDECIQRGIALGNEKIVICKAAQTLQNKKFDLPTIGPNTLKNIKPGQVAAIAWDARHTLVTEQQTFIRLAQSLGITLVSV